MSVNETSTNIPKKKKKKKNEVGVKNNRTSKVDQVFFEKQQF